MKHMTIAYTLAGILILAGSITALGNLLQSTYPSLTPPHPNISPSPQTTASVTPKPSETSLTEPKGKFCIQVITPARNTRTGEVRDFSTPCDVPAGWEPLQYNGDAF